METALFTFKKVKTLKNGETVYNENYINPLLVVWFYWDTNENGVKTLSIFTFGGGTNKDGGQSFMRTTVFPEKLGQRFVEHMEDFLRLSLARSLPQVAAQEQPKHYENYRRNDPKRGRRPDASLVIDEGIPVDDSPVSEAKWEMPQV